MAPTQGALFMMCCKVHINPLKRKHTFLLKTPPADDEIRGFAGNHGPRLFPNTYFIFFFSTTIIYCIP